MRMKENTTKGKRRRTARMGRGRLRKEGGGRSRRISL
jgi:hypothetical protein